MTSAQRPHAVRRMAAVAALTAMSGLTACGGRSSAVTKPSTRPAAEPASAPPARARPAGRSVKVGTLPEGIIADAASGVVVVAVRNPPALVLLDARSGRVLRRVAIASAPRHLALVAPGGQVLVPAEPTDQLLELSLTTGRVRAVPVGAHPHDAGPAFGRVYVSNEFGRSVSVVSGSRAIGRIGGFVQPAGIAQAGGEVAVVDVGADTITLIDPARLRPVAQLAAGDGPTHVVADGDRLYVIDTRGDAVLTYTARPALRLLGRFPLAATPHGVAIDPARHRLWVTETATDRLAELAIEGRSLRLVTTYPTARQPNTVAVDGHTGHVYVADAGAGVVQVITPRR